MADLSLVNHAPRWPAFLSGHDGHLKRQATMVGLGKSVLYIEVSTMKTSQRLAYPPSPPPFNHVEQSERFKRTG